MSIIFQSYCSQSALLVRETKEEDISVTCVTVEHVLTPKKAMSPMGFNPETSRIVWHRSTNWAKGSSLAQLVEQWLTIRSELTRDNPAFYTQHVPTKTRNNHHRQFPMYHWIKFLLFHSDDYCHLAVSLGMYLKKKRSELDINKKKSLFTII